MSQAAVAAGTPVSPGRLVATQSRLLTVLFVLLIPIAGTFWWQQHEADRTLRDQLVSGCERGNTQRQIIREVIIAGDLKAARIVVHGSSSAEIRDYYRRTRIPALEKAYADPDIAAQDCRARFR